MVSDDELRYEQSRVDAAYMIADEKAERLREKLAAPIIAGDNKSADILKRGYETKLARLEEVTRPDAEFLLFGRVDFSSDASVGDLAGLTYYVGLDGLSEDGSADPTVIAWESPMADAFRNPTQFHGGAAVHRTRQFVGEKRSLVEISEVRYSEGQPEPGAGDPLLEALKGRISGQMRQIVATIQAEQFRLMDYPHDRTLVVQGGPGTGKTVVGLHRVSVILYRSEGQLTEGDILVVGPSDIFVRYIERVLPGLGRAAVQHRPITRVGAHGLTPKFPDTVRAREIKGRAVMADVIGNYLSQRVSKDLAELVIAAGVRLTGKELQTVLDFATDETVPYAVRRLNVKAAIQRAVGSGTSRSDTAIDNAVNRVMPDISEKQAVHDILTGKKLLAAAAEGLLSLEEQAAIHRPRTKMEEAPWTADDLPLLDEAAWKLRGAERRGQRFLHIVVDEAQDLSPMQLRVLQRRLDPSGGMTILGDLAQATSPWAPDAWDTHLEAGGLQADDVAELTVSYRIPATLLDFGNRLLKVIDVRTAPGESVITDGDEPVIIAEEEPEAVLARATDIIDSLVDVSDVGQIGVIGTEQQLRALSQVLDDQQVPHTWAARSLLEPVTLVPVEDAKGLEFDHVVVLEPGQLYRADSVLGPRSLFVAMTRARDTLTLVHSTPLPPVLVDEASPTAGGRREGTAEPVQAEPSALTDPRTPSAASHPTAEAPNPDAGSWRWFVPTETGLFEVNCTRDGSVLVTAVPTQGGAPRVVASGHKLAGRAGDAWALITDSGAPVAVATTNDTAVAATTVVEAVSAASIDLEIRPS